MDTKPKQRQDQPDPARRNLLKAAPLGAIAVAAAVAGNKAEAARFLGLARSTFVSRLSKYGLS